MQIGVISDTHGLLRPEAIAALAGVHRVLHAGDIGGPDILRELQRIAPVSAVRGNNDRDAWADSLPEVADIELGGTTIRIIHDLQQLGRYAVPGRPQIVISGHSHKPSVLESDGVLFLNPGSAGPRRFRLPVCVARLTLGPSKPAAEILELPVAAAAAGRKRR
jgi:putative phosphoesterase